MFLLLFVSFDGFVFDLGGLFCFLFKEIEYETYLQCLRNTFPLHLLPIHCEDKYLHRTVDGAGVCKKDN